MDNQKHVMLVKIELIYNRNNTQYKINKEGNGSYRKSIKKFSTVKFN